MEGETHSGTGRWNWVSDMYKTFIGDVRESCKSLHTEYSCHTVYTEHSIVELDNLMAENGRSFFLSIYMYISIAINYEACHCPLILM